MKVNDILKSRYSFDAFMVALAHAKLTNVSGSAYKCHPQMYWEDGILLTSHWRTDNSCDIKIASDPDAALVLGVNDSWSNRSPYPSVATGSLVIVWNGGWVSQGPWQKRVVAVVGKLARRLEAYRYRKTVSNHRERIRVAKRAKLEKESLIAAWS